MLLSTIIGKKILSQDGNELGYVLRALFTRNRAKLFALVGVDNDENEFFLPARAVLFVGDALVCSSARLEEADGQQSPVGLFAYSDRGTALGAVCDVAIEQDGTYLIVEHDEMRYPVSRARFGQVAILRADASQPKRKSEKRVSENEEPPQKQAAATDNEFNRLNLLGRRLRKNTFDADGNTVALAGELITPEILSHARRSNCLLRLTVNALTNL